MYNLGPHDPLCVHPMTTKTFTAAEIDEAALRLAHVKHVSEITREEVAAEAGCSPNYLVKLGRPMDTVRDQVIRLARKRGLLRTIHAVPLKRKAPLSRAHILDAGLRVARRMGPQWARMSRREVAAEANCSDGTVSRYFGSIQDLRHAVAQRLRA